MNDYIFSIIIIIVNIVFLLLGITFIILGIYLLVNKKIFNIDSNMVQSLLIVGLGVLGSLISIGVIIYIPATWNRKVRNLQISDGTLNENSNLLARRLKNCDAASLRSFQDDYVIKDKIPVLNIFNTMIFSTHYNTDENKYKGNNFRNGQIIDGHYTNPTIDIFSEYNFTVSPEHRRILDSTPVNTNEYDDRNFNDDRIIVFWTMYKNYMENVYNHNMTLQLLKTYRDSIYTVFKTYEYDCVKIFKGMIMPNLIESYKSVFKLINRKLIPFKTGTDILNILKSLIYYVYPDTGYDLNEDINPKLYKEIIRNNYHPVNILHKNDIIFQGYKGFNALQLFLNYSFK